MWCVVWSLLYGVVGVVLFIFAWGWWKNGVLRRRGIKSLPAYLPFIGNMTFVVTRKKHFKDFLQDIYTMYPEERYIGIIQLGVPTVVIRDVELLKKVTVKDFDHFADHVISFIEDSDLLLGKGLFSISGQRWRDMRATLSPAFTSSKMRGMFQFIVDCGEKMTEYYLNQMDTEENKVRGMVELEMKEAYSRYATDIIASCGFGLDINSFTDRNNEFFLAGKGTADLAGWKMLRFMIIILLPTLAKIFNIQFLSKNVEDLYRNLVLGTMKYREDNKIIRQDMIHLLMEARKGTLKHDSHDNEKESGFATVEESSVGKTAVKRDWDDDDLLAQIVLFFLAGFDTTTTLLCFLTHEVALQPEVLRKLQKEIDEVAASTNGKLTYDSLQNMKYLDMVVCEALRKWPPNIGVDRKCTKPYTLPAPNSNSGEIQLNEGEGVEIPIYAFHHDPKYFEDPEVFDPERFSDENKHKIQPFTYIPFGVGPRNCIGSRFVLMETKAVIYNLLLKFDIVTTAKTQHPLKLNMKTLVMHAEKGFWLGLKPRIRNPK